MAPRKPRNSQPKAAARNTTPSRPLSPATLTPELKPDMPEIFLPASEPELTLGDALALAEQADLPPPPPVFTEEDDKDTIPFEESEAEAQSDQANGVKVRPLFSYIEDLQKYPEQIVSKFLLEAPLASVAKPDFWNQLHKKSSKSFDTPKEVVKAAAALGKLVMENSVATISKNKRQQSPSHAAFTFMKRHNAGIGWKRHTTDIMHECRPAKSKCQGFETPLHNQRHLYAISLFFKRSFESLEAENKLDSI